MNFFFWAFSTGLKIFSRNGTYIECEKDNAIDDEIENVECKEISKMYFLYIYIFNCSIDYFCILYLVCVFLISIVFCCHLLGTKVVRISLVS